MSQMKKTTSVNMTEGSIVRRVLLFSLPLMLGNVFQMLYNTVDMVVVGNFVGKEALAAVGSTAMVTNMAVFFFNGFSVGASVVGASVGASVGAGFWQPATPKESINPASKTASSFFMAESFVKNVEGLKSGIEKFFERGK